MHPRLFLSAAIAGVLAMTGFARAADEPVKTLASSNTAFAIELFQQLNQNAATAGPKNLFFSPYSISSALSMVDMGARNATADQMNKVLHIDMEPVATGPAGTSRPPSTAIPPPNALTSFRSPMPCGSINRFPSSLRMSMR